nr:hypothetical protein [uncultured Albidiferax sp.]
MDKYSEDWSWRLEANQVKTTRERVGQWLRRLADRIDGRTSQALRLTTQPPLDRATTLEVYRQGQLQMQRSVEQACVLAAEECLLQRLRPELFGQSRG